MVVVRRPATSIQDGAGGVVANEQRAAEGQVAAIVACPSSYKLEQTAADLKEDLANLVQVIKRRICVITSDGSPSF